MTFLIKNKKMGLYWNKEAAKYVPEDQATRYESPPAIMKSREEIVRKGLENVEP